VVSQVVSAVTGRGVLYYITMTSVLVVLALSANTSFADFPRVCRVLAADRYLPPEFARRGSRLVFTNGIVVLAVLAGLLLIVFGGITDHLIPLFAVGALLAFTMFQLGMVVHWRRSNEAGRKPKMIVNTVGAFATTAALCIVMVSKFAHGAWITALVIPGFVLFFRRLKQYNEGLAAAVRAEGPLDVSNLAPPVVVIPLRRLDQVGQKALRFALTISPDVYVVQVLAEELDTTDLQSQWPERVEKPVRRELRSRPPQLVVIRSPSAVLRAISDMVAGADRNQTRSAGDRFDSRTRPTALVPVRRKSSGDAVEGAAAADRRASRIRDVDSLVS
jgi:hypothetical protein